MDLADLGAAKYPLLLNNEVMIAKHKGIGFHTSIECCSSSIPPPQEVTEYDTSHCAHLNNQHTDYASGFHPNNTQQMVYKESLGVAL